MLILIIFPLFSINAEERVVRFVTVDWPPFFAENLPQQGYVSEVTREAFKRVGYKVTIDFVPWARALKMVEYGDADAALGAYYTPERATYSVYSKPIVKSPDVFFKKKGSSALNTYENLKDLKGYSIQGDRTNRSKSHFRCYSSLNRLDLVCFEVSEHIKM